jgi:predicted kinase
VDRPSNQQIVIVSGPPGSGKTTLARPLAERLGFALLTKDDIKETLYTSLRGEPGDLEFSRRIGSAAMDLLWALSLHCPQVVLEANFRTKTVHEREQLALLLGRGIRIAEVYCRIPREDASRRFAERARQSRHHPAHALAEMSPERMMVYEEPFALTPVIEVDTRTRVDVDSLAAQVSAILAG